MKPNFEYYNLPWKAALCCLKKKKSSGHYLWLLKQDCHRQTLLPSAGAYVWDTVRLFPNQDSHLLSTLLLSTLYTVQAHAEVSTALSLLLNGNNWP